MPTLAAAIVRVVNRNMELQGRNVSQRFQIARFVYAYAQDGQKTTAQIPLEDQMLALRLLAEVKVHAAAVALTEQYSSSVERIGKLVDLYPEMLWLTGGVNATPEIVDPRSNEGATVGEKLFASMQKEALIEFNRTALGVLTLSWVLTGDYESFTACQKEGVRLTRESFDQLRAYTLRVLPSPESIDAMVVYSVIKDLGKVRSIVSQIESKIGMQEVDHDVILLRALETCPETSPSFSRLSPYYKSLILEGLRSQYNILQLVQGENVPASLAGLVGMSQEALDFYLLDALYNLSGAAGQAIQNGSAVMTEATYQGFALAIRAVEGLNQGKTLEDVYSDFLRGKAALFGFNIDNPVERAVTRICCMLRIASASRAAEVLAEFKKLPVNTRAILEKELNITGVNDGIAIMQYYAPAFLLNIQSRLEKLAGPPSFREALEIGLTTMARVFQEARINIRRREGNGVYTVMISELARKAAEDPRGLIDLGIELEPVGTDAEAKVKVMPNIEASEFPQMESLASIPGKNVIVVGIGGGSDVIQAAMMAKLLERAGKSCRGIISVRTDKTTSQGVSGRVGEERTIQNHGGKIIEGVYIVLPGSTGSGRFLENIPAEQYPSFLVIDKEGRDLTASLQSVLTKAGEVDTVVLVDTGGDALYQEVGLSDGARTTPDQDIRTLRAARKLAGVDKISVEIAVGVDSPDNSSAILQAAGAQYFALFPEDRESVMQQYEVWRMDGSDETRFGKTPLAWQAALAEKRGFSVLPLPSRVICDSKNPWLPFVRITPSMAGAFIMRLEDHLRAIGGF
jgi:hypothetical protein